VFDAASRYLLFPLKRAVTDALMPQLETATPADLCGWLLLADKYVTNSGCSTSPFVHRKLDQLLKVIELAPKCEIRK